jgi:hypothetical protein
VPVQYRSLIPTGSPITGTDASSRARKSSRTRHEAFPVPQFEEKVECVPDPEPTTDVHPSGKSVWRFVIEPPLQHHFVR